MGTRLNNRPIQKNISSDIIKKNSAMTLDYNLEKVQELYFSKYDNALIKMKGVQVTSASTNKSVLSFNNTTYVFDKIIITNDFDKISQNGTSPSNYDIALIFSFTETNGNRNLFLTIPLKKGTGETNVSQEFVNELLDEISIIKTNNTSNISLDEAFDLNNVLENTNFNSNQYIYYSSSGTSLFIVPYLENSTLTDNNFNKDGFSTTIFSSRTHVTLDSEINTDALYIMETPPQKVSNVMNENNLSDIYIDCSPISSDASYQIIEPRKLKLVSNIFGNADKLINDNITYKLIFALVVFMIGCFLFYKTVKQTAKPFFNLCSNIYHIFNDTKKIKENFNNIPTYTKFVTIQNGILSMIKIYLIFAVISIFAFIVLSALQQVKVNGTTFNAFNITMIVLFVFVALLWLFLVKEKTHIIKNAISELPVLEPSKLPVPDPTRFMIAMLIFVSAITICFFFLLKEYIQWWDLYDRDGPGDIINIWIGLGLFTLFAKLFYIPLQHLKLDNNNNHNDKMIINSINHYYEKNWKLNLYKDYIIKDNKQLKQ